MDVNALPTITETKRTLAGGQKTFPCRVLDRSAGALTVLFISDRPYQVGGLDLPTGTVTFGHFWAGRPYNVYHWMTPAGATLAYYFNLADQTAIGPDTLSYRDLTVDLLARPGLPAQVLDQDELPADLDLATRRRINHALRAARTDLGHLRPLLEVRADALWLQTFRQDAPVITLVQRVTRAEVRVANAIVGQIGPGLLLFVGVERGDTEADADATARKIAALRIFAGRHPMDQAVADVGGSCLVVSQFTLAGSIRKGNRPGFEGAEAPARAQALYERVAAQIAATGIPVATGQFAADMQVSLVNDGPVTFVVVVRNGVVEKTER